jgi:hypothetical protein
MIFNLIVSDPLQRVVQYLFILGYLKTIVHYQKKKKKVAFTWFFTMALANYNSFFYFLYI